jgi:multidrug transporter EmrE-like cation transporter
VSSRLIRIILNHPIALVFGCTLLGAAAQVFMKMGAIGLSRSAPLQLLTNFPLLFGYSLYGISTLFLVLALRRGQLSILYPVIALTYVWVTILSMLIFRETMNVVKGIGLAIVVGGVGILGTENSTKPESESGDAEEPELASVSAREGTDR